LALVATAAVVILLVVLTVPKRAAPSLATYLTATIRQNNGAAGWTVTVDLRGARAILVPATPPALPAGRVTELWLIPPGGAPLPVGVFSGNGASTLPLDAALLRQLTHIDTLAVSVEPPGGSPTGQPTGPVVAQGMVGPIAGSRDSAT
jgi:anti-sigma-K factor RskA